MIPSVAHFCWIGSELPWAYAFAVLSAADRGGLSEVVLHHTDDLNDTPPVRALQTTPGVRLSKIDPIALTTEVGRTAGLGDRLVELYGRLGHPVMCADVLRAAILHERGGIYIDLDTLTMKSLHPLLGCEPFLGREFIVWPRDMRQSRSPFRWVRALCLDLMRKAARRLPEGWKLFRRIEHLYFRGLNNAVIGAPAQAPLITAYLRGMVELPLDRQTACYGLGPDLLEDVVARYCRDDLRLERPEVFYPLGPEVSEHWFRIRRHATLTQILSPNTRIVHWYASVRTRARVELVNPEYVRRHRHRQFYSALVCQCVRRLPELD